MRRGLVLAPVGAALFAVSAASGQAGAGATVKIPLPPAGHVRIAAFAVTSAAAPKPIATNAAKLGSRQMNTQVVAAVKTGSASGKYVVYVFIHRFPSVTRRAAYAEEFADIFVKGAKVDKFVGNIGCDHGSYDFTGKTDFEGLKQNGFYDDSWTKQKTFKTWNEVPAFDTDTEEQIDNAVHAQCPAAEGDDPGSS